MMRRVEKRKMKGEWAEQGSPRGRRGAGAGCRADQDGRSELDSSFTGRP